VLHEFAGQKVVPALDSARAYGAGAKTTIIDGGGAPTIFTLTAMVTFSV
jgi:hypothetical protein